MGRYVWEYDYEMFKPSSNWTIPFSNSCDRSKRRVHGIVWVYFREEGEGIFAMGLRVGAIGRTKFLHDAIKLLHEKGHQIKIVVTAPPAKEYKVGPKEFEQLAEKIGAKYFFSTFLDVEIKKEIRTLDLNIGISVNWVSILNREDINLFGIGILNAHMGDLPRYKGNACPNWAILEDERDITLTLHMMEPGKLDCGKVILQKRFPLTENTYITHVYEWAEEILPCAFLEAIEMLEKQSHYFLKYASCNKNDGFRAYPRIPEYSLIDWSKSPGEVYRLIRASSLPFEGAYTYHLVSGKIKKLFIYQARIVVDESPDLAMPGHVLMNDINSGESWVKCGRGIIALKLCKYEDEDSCFLPGRRWKSIRMRLGINSQDMIYEMWKKLTLR